MYIPIDEKYILTSDTNNYILQKVETIKSGANAGRQRKGVVAYHSTLDGLFKAYFNHALRDSKARDFEQLFKRWEELEERIENILQVKIKEEEDE